jgi:lactate permease
LAKRVQTKDEATMNMTTDENGPWGPAGDVFVYISPLAMLVFVSVYGKGMPAFKSLPIAALYMVFIVLAYQGAPAQLVLGAIIQGTLDSLTPVSIIGGAMFLFETMDASGSMAWIAQVGWLDFTSR